MLSDTEQSTIPTFRYENQDLLIAERLIVAVGGDTMRSLSCKIGYNQETTRRYMRGESRIPANFIRQVALRYNYDANTLLCLPPYLKSDLIKSFPTDQLINEIGQRIKLIENCALASVVVGPE